MSFSKRSIPLLLIAALIAPFSAPTTAQAFDPNLIITDEEMQSWNSMSRADIQDFLEAQGGYLSQLVTEDSEGDEKSAAAIIADTAREFRINPKYILVTLQKESSVIRDPDPTKRQLDWAAGYGICDACKKDDPKLQKFRGFGNQVSYSAGIMRWYYDNMDEQSWIRRKGQTFSINGESVKPASNATAFLYNYTPHFHGNENFYKIWEQWFNETYPDGSLVRSEKDGRVYLIQDGVRRHVKNMSVLLSRFNPELILSVPESELLKHDIGAPISFPNYSILTTGSKYYLVDFDELRPFASADVVRQLGYHPDEILDVSKNDIKDYRIGDTITGPTAQEIRGELVRTGSGQLYYLKNGTLSPMIDDSVAIVRFPDVTERAIDAGEFLSYTIGEILGYPNGTLIKNDVSAEVYFIENGTRRHIKTADDFVALGFNWNNIHLVSDSVTAILPSGPTLQASASLRNRLEQRYETDASEDAFIDELPDDALDSFIRTIDIDLDARVADVTPTKEEVKKQTPADLMIRTPKADWSYIGPTFFTEVDAYLVMDAQSKEILAGKNVDVERQLASLTKVMTAHELMDARLDLAGVTIYDERRHKAPYHRFRLEDGEMVINRDLMDALLVSSLNTPAHMLVDQTGLSLTDFVKRMNSQTRQWGLSRTTFADVSGLSNDNVSTAREYATVFLKSLEDDTVGKYLRKKQYEYLEVVDKDMKPTHYDVHSNALTREDDNSFTVLESKTGYLYESGANLAMVVERKTDGKQFVIITLGNPDYANRFAAPRVLTEWALAQF